MHNDEHWCTIMHNAVHWCTLMHGDARWCTMMHGDAQWWTSMNNNVKWYTMLHNDEQWCTMMHNDARWCTMMHDDARWCTMMHNDAQCAGWCRTVQDSWECTYMAERQKGKVTNEVQKKRRSTHYLRCEHKRCTAYDCCIANRSVNMCCKLSAATQGADNMALFKKPLKIMPPRKPYAYMDYHKVLNKGCIFLYWL